MAGFMSSPLNTNFQQQLVLNCHNAWCCHVWLIVAEEGRGLEATEGQCVPILNESHHNLKIIISQGFDKKVLSESHEVDNAVSAGVEAAGGKGNASVRSKEVHSASHAPGKDAANMSRNIKAHDYIVEYLPRNDVISMNIDVECLTPTNEYVKIASNLHYSTKQPIIFTNLEVKKLIECTIHGAWTLSVLCCGCSLRQCQF